MCAAMNPRQRRAIHLLALAVAGLLGVFVLVANYVGFVAPKLAMFSSIGLMVAVLMWRPQGLYPVVNR